MKKLDLKKEYRALFHAPLKSPELIIVPELIYLMIDGQGDPNTAASYHEAIEALYSMSYTLKFMLKKGKASIDYGVPPLEGLWWTTSMADFSVERKDSWLWTAMIMQPSVITEDLVKKAMDQVAAKKSLPALTQIRFSSFAEGQAAQIMHIGPYATEAPTIRKLHQFIEANGYCRSGKHHEIYVSDPRRCSPEKMKTIIRQPVSLRDV
ncbi:MAG: GyrI-like domain-containing protein [Ignavibacteriales bacterium]|nr:GyrI-like domain-containing protein [Ignavibacteriales bacterium]